jgi:heptosyltransferase II
MPKILLIKTGAAGDIVRTTVLLNILEGDVTWVIDKRYQDLLPANHPAIAHIITPENAAQALQHESFDYTISLEEDPVCASLASTIPTKKLVGIYTENSHIHYTANSACWFDLSLVSKLGRDAANEAKWHNTSTFQQLLFNMLDRSFNNEPYCIYRNTSVQTEKDLIGIETRAGARWPNKAWSGYQQLIEKLQLQGYRCTIFQQQKNIRHYLDDIARCAFIISGDTLAMHVAMAYQIPSIAIFNCTSPAEIFDYGTMQKVINPLLQQAFYNTGFSQAVVDAVSPSAIFTAFVQHPMVNASVLKRPGSVRVPFQ